MLNDYSTYLPPIVSSIDYPKLTNDPKSSLYWWKAVKAGNAEIKGISAHTMIIEDTVEGTYSLGNNPIAQNAPVCANNNNKGNKPMNYDFEYEDDDMNPTSIAPEKTYLLGRVSEIDHQKRSSLKNTFGLVDNLPPETAVELVDRIKNGKFIFSDDKRATQKSYNPVGFIRWRAPDMKEDLDGFDAAVSELRTFTQKTKDLVVVKSADEGLAAIQALEAWTPTGKAN